VPISLISEPHTHAIVVVDTNALEEHYLDHPSKPSSRPQGLTLPGWVKDYQGKMKTNFPEGRKKDTQRTYSALELVNRSFDLLQDRYCQLLLENYPVDAQIKIARKQCGTLEFHRAAELIEIGRIKTATALDRMEHGN
jgi:NTE family protein